MRTWNWVMPMTLLGLHSCLVVAWPEHQHKGSGHVHKRCPFADVSSEAKEEVYKRSSTTMNSPIDVTGEHSFVPPNFENGDQRGPCPGLNALANHGYIPHNGVVSFGEVITAANEVFGMGIDLATVLAVMGTVWVGDPISLDPSFSIGGVTPAVTDLLDNLGGLLGEPQGLIGSHNFIESDGSNTRDDLYVTGNNYQLNMEKFLEWYNMSTDGTFGMDLMAERANICLEKAKQTNPNFFYGPVTGLVARNAGFVFPARLLANYSQDNSEGVTTKEIVRNFFAIYEEEDKLVYREGWERIPMNWYKTPMDYGLLELNSDIVKWALKYPELASFTGIDISDLSGGVLNMGTLLEGNNLLCLVFEVLKLASPDALGGLYKTLAVPLELIENIIAAPLLNLSCPAFENLQMGGKPFWSTALNVFSGAKKSGSAL
ncbi:hypothetical protein N7474_002478 [Penicillium riverlandense]|uniref:uncharacterized protein n=1 Tax=Penicillium riverlandense TaxID=1903569 RepID=UPI002546EBBA|nr:uncharacterized protein N7474_002478 [Penicillium riverlandense]KAJ5825340.1 hypothetical protein N7474_002478 [Penicillium riverlandense]